METKFRASYSGAYGASGLHLPGAPGRQDPFRNDVLASANDAASLPDGRTEEAVARDEHDRRSMQSRRDGKKLPSDLGLRLIGLLLIAFSAAMTYALFHLAHMQGHVASVLDYILALVAFAAASSGSVMLCLGAHIFDEVAVSSRWRTRR